MPVYRDKDTHPEIISPTFSRRVFWLDNLMTVICDFTGGPAKEPDPPHSHPHEQTTYVAEGEIYFFIDGEKHRLSAGDIYTVPSGRPHCIQLLSKSARLIDSFTPLRDDFIKK